MRIRLAFPDDIVSPATIAAALEASTVANEALGARGALPDIERAIRDGLVKWRPEPFSDGEHFDLAPEVLRRGWGDCDDLAPWLAAQLRMEGEDARAIAMKSGSSRYHALVEREDGQLLDPSKWAGMGRGGNGKRGVHGANYSPLVPPGWNALALAPHGGGWGARADLAGDDDEHVCSCAWDRDSKRAAQRAIAGFAAACEGIYGVDGEDVGSFLDSVIPLATTLAPMALGLPPGSIQAATGLLGNIMPGGAAPPPGAPGPPMAPGGAASHTVPFTTPRAGDGSSRARGGGNLTYVPGGGPIIVRF